MNMNEIPVSGRLVGLANKASTAKFSGLANFRAAVAACRAGPCCPTCWNDAAWCGATHGCPTCQAVVAGAEP